MTRWEYLLETVPTTCWGDMSWIDDNHIKFVPQLSSGPCASLRQHLARRGAEGWELVWMERSNGVNFEGWQYLFKRPKEETSGNV